MSKDNRLSVGNQEEGLYKFFLCKGNNSKLIRRVLETRDWCSELPEKYQTSLFDFKWTPYSKHCHFEVLSSGHKNLVNHFEKHDQLTTKDQLYMNMYRFCELQKLNVFEYMPLQFVIDFSNKGFLNEVERFVQLFTAVDNVKSKAQ